MQERKNGHNQRITRESSWLNAIFEEYKLSAEEKKKVLRSVIRDIRKEELKAKK